MSLSHTSPGPNIDGPSFKQQWQQATSRNQGGFNISTYMSMAIMYRPKWMSLFVSKTLKEWVFSWQKWRYLGKLWLFSWQKWRYLGKPSLFGIVWKQVMGNLQAVYFQQRLSQLCRQLSPAVGSLFRVFGSTFWGVQGDHPRSYPGYQPWWQWVPLRPK